MSRETDLRKLWEKRKHSYFDENYKTYWLQIKDGDEDMINGEDKEPVEGKSKTPFSKLKVSKAYKMLEQYLNPIPNSVSRTVEGYFDFEIPREEMETVLTISQLEGTSVKIEKHKFKNRTRGTVFHPGTIEMEEEEILSDLKSYHVTKVTKKKFKDKRDNQTKYSGEVTVVFDLVQLPQSISILWLRNLNVNQYEPKPLLCNFCYTFNPKCFDFTGDKLSNKCQQQVVKLCGWCLKKDHVDTTSGDKCENLALCRNCEGNHPSWSKDCRVYQKEVEIRRIKEINKISLKRARDIVEGKTYSKKPTIANVFARDFDAKVKELNNIIEQNKIDAEERRKMDIVGNDDMWKRRMLVVHEKNHQKENAWKEKEKSMHEMIVNLTQQMHTLREEMNTMQMQAHSAAPITTSGIQWTPHQPQHPELVKLRKSLEDGDAESLSAAKKPCLDEGKPPDK